jgi:photosystem II stability/assembly factor-like uncharacterized protein
VVGASDVVLDPRNPDVIIATTWQRFRRQWGYIAGGPQSGIWRSTDAGATWKKSQTGFPATDDLGRIGLAMAPANPDVVYAVAEAANARGGFFRSRDGGVNWERMSGYQPGGLYYNEIFPDPVNVDRVYAVDVQTMITEDGGRNFRRLGERNKHVDNHVVWIDPDDTEHLLIGCDGGLYESFDRGQTYRFFANLPITQFYHVDTDNALPLLPGVRWNAGQLLVRWPVADADRAWDHERRLVRHRGWRRISVTRRPEGPQHRVRRVAARQPAALQSGDR